MTDRLYRSRDDRLLAGVAGAVAEMLDVDPSIVRIVWAVLVFPTGGLALVVYIVMAIVVPERPLGLVARRTGDAAPGASSTAATGAQAQPMTEGGWRAPDVTVGPRSSGAAARPARRHSSGAVDGTHGWLIISLVLMMIGGYFLVRQLAPAFDLELWWPIGAIGLGVLLIVLAVLPRRRSD